MVGMTQRGLSTPRSSVAEDHPQGRPTPRPAVTRASMLTQATPVQAQEYEEDAGADTGRASAWVARGLRVLCRNLTFNSSTANHAGSQVPCDVREY